jgi:hypothetical protein
VIRRPARSRSAPTGCIISRDLFLNGAVIAALAAGKLCRGLAGADAVFGIGIGLWLLYGAWRASVAAIDQLMDKEWPEEKRQRFVEVAGRHPELIAACTICAPAPAARDDFVQFHIWMDPQMTLGESHDVVEARGPSCARNFPGVEITDPCRSRGPSTNPAIEAEPFAHEDSVRPDRRLRRQPFTGNPAAVMPLEAWLDDATLQAIAEENNLAETAFIVPGRAARPITSCAGSRPRSRSRCAAMRRLASGHVLLSRNPAVERIALPHAQSGRARSRAATATAIDGAARLRPSRSQLPDLLERWAVAGETLRIRAATLFRCWRAPRRCSR